MYMTWTPENDGACPEKPFHLSLVPESWCSIKSLALNTLVPANLLLVVNHDVLVNSIDGLSMDWQMCPIGGEFAYYSNLLDIDSSLRMPYELCVRVNAKGFSIKGTSQPLNKYSYLSRCNITANITPSRNLRCRTCEPYDKQPKNSCLYQDRRLIQSNAFHMLIYSL